MRPRRPALISQLRALDPGGAPDPAASTDCGESCVASVFRTRRGVLLSPGCVRQMLSKPTYAGNTTPDDVRTAGDALQLQPLRHDDLSPVRVKAALDNKHWLVALGYWQGPNELHWVLAYDYGAGVVWFMDPWTGRYRELQWATWQSLGQGKGVAFPDPIGRE